VTAAQCSAIVPRAAQKVVRQPKTMATHSLRRNPGAAKSKLRWPLHIVSLLLLLAWPFAIGGMVFASLNTPAYMHEVLGFLINVVYYYPAIVLGSIGLCSYLQWRGKRPGWVSLAAAVPLLTPVPLLAIGLAVTLLGR
jgi:ABC-type phosphate transport system permease subunit